MGKHSGRAALTKRLSDLGFKFDDAQINDVFIRFKKVSSGKVSSGVFKMKELPVG